MSAIASQASRLLCVERVALGLLRDGALQVLADLVQHEGHELFGLRLRQRLEGEAIDAGSGSEGGTPLEELGPRRRDDHERHMGDMACEVLQEVEEGVVRPVEVLDYEHGEFACCEVLKEAQPGGEVLLTLRRRRLETEEGAQALPEPGPVLALRQHGLELRLDRLAAVGLEDAGVRLDDLRECPEGDPLAIGQAATLSPGDHLRSGVDAGEQLADQPGLADAGLADDEGDLRRCGSGRLVEQGGQVR